MLSIDNKIILKDELNKRLMKLFSSCNDYNKLSVIFQIIYTIWYSKNEKLLKRIRIEFEKEKWFEKMILERISINYSIKLKSIFL